MRIVLLLAGAFGLALAETAHARVVVEEVPLGYGGEVAGLAPGDAIQSWSRSAHPPANPRAAHGKIRTPFDLLRVDIEQGPRGSVTLIGLRDGRRTRWTMPSDEWRLVVAPILPAPLAARHDQAKQCLAEHEASDAAASWEEAADGAERQQDRRLAAWFLYRAAGALAVAREWARVDDFYARAVALLEKERAPRETSMALYAWAESFGWRAQWKDAGARGEQALRLQESIDAPSLATARLFRARGDAFFSDRPVAESWYRRSLELRERLAPDSGAVADSLSSLGRSRVARLDVGGQQDLQRALRIRDAVMPDGRAAALDRSALARVALLLGDREEASDQVRRALSVLERTAPQSIERAHALTTAARIARQTGDLGSAESRYRDALQIYERLYPGGVIVAGTLHALSSVAWDRRDFATAQDRAREALAIYERRAPGGHAESELLHHLGDIALDRGDPAGAETYFRRALEQHAAREPEGRDVASQLRCLSLAVARSGRLEEAEGYARRSLEMRRRLEPNTMHLSRSLVALAEIATRRGRYGSAQELYQEAVAISARLLPGTREEAQVHYGLGQAQRRDGRLAASAESFARATADLEWTQARLGGTQEAQAGFAAAYARYYQDQIEVLVELGRTHDAFQALERSRARSLVTLLAERAAAFFAEMPPEVERARGQNQAAYDRVLAALADLPPARSAESEPLLQRLRDLRSESGEITARMRAAMPRLAAWHAPEPLDVAAARAAFDADEAFVAFSVGPDRTIVFVLGPRAAWGDDGLAVYTVPISEDELRKEVESFRGLIEHRGTLEDLREQGARLYDRLLGPAEARLARCRRLALSPDGPLHLLPFAALVKTEAGVPPPSGRWVAEWLPVHVVGSATQYVELEKARRDRAPSDMKLVAFGDPRSSPPLPFSRREVEALVTLFGTQAVAYLGDEATESRLKAGLRDVSHVHFACHAVLDEHLPLHSALLLSPPPTLEDGGDNGQLQVWEILDGVRLDAELVTLSGCNTALGPEMGGEGLLGLTRAFQYAGARSVLATLWSVSDRSSADLMRRFYTHLRAGQTKDDALRAAQIETMRGTAHPFRWAAFQLNGDWR